MSKSFTKLKFEHGVIRGNPIMTHDSDNNGRTDAYDFFVEIYDCAPGEIVFT